MVLLLIFNNKLRKFIPFYDKLLYNGIFLNINNALNAYNGLNKYVILVFLLSIAGQLINVLAIFIFGKSVELNLPFLLTCAFGSLGLVVNALPIGPPGGIGLGEGAFALLFASAGSMNGALTMIIYRSVLYALSLIGLPLYFLKKPTLSADKRGD